VQPAVGLVGEQAAGAGDAPPALPEGDQHLQQLQQQQAEAAAGGAASALAPAAAAAAVHTAPEVSAGRGLACQAGRTAAIACKVPCA